MYRQRQRGRHPGRCPGLMRLLPATRRRWLQLPRRPHRCLAQNQAGANGEIPGESTPFAVFCSFSHIRNIHGAFSGIQDTGIFIFSLMGLKHFDTLRVSFILGSRGHFFFFAFDYGNHIYTGSLNRYPLHEFDTLNIVEGLLAALSASDNEPKASI